MEKKMATTIMGYIGTTTRIHSSIPGSPEVRLLKPEEFITVIPV